MKYLLTCFLTINFMLMPGLYANAQTTPTSNEALIEQYPQLLTLLARLLEIQKIIISMQSESQTNSLNESQMTEVDTKADGFIVLHNSYSSEPIRLAINTRLATAEGLIFRMQETETIPGYTLNNNGQIIPGSVVVYVKADQPGVQYNVNHGTRFTVPGFKDMPQYDDVYGVSNGAIEVEL